MGLKSLVRPLVPQSIVDLWRSSVAGRIDKSFSELSPAEVFTEVYRRKLWNRGGSGEFCSGTGSRTDAVVQPYAQAVRQFLEALPRPPHAVDLGCGDFNVGARICDLCAAYTACDVVPSLIDRNRDAFSHLGVEFKCLDIVADPLPPGDIAFLRQVLQHLSNQQIVQVLRKLPQYRWVILTEHLPRRTRFSANLDKPIGPGIRLRFQSGVVITQPPFDVKPLEHQVLCSAVEGTGVIQTAAYRLQA